MNERGEADYLWLKQSQSQTLLIPSNGLELLVD